MSTILGLPAPFLAGGLAGITGGLLLIMIGMAARNPILFHLGLRNMVRRPSQTVILLSGLVLSAVLIAASLSMNDSFVSSASDSRLPQMGSVDETVTGTFQQNLLDQNLTQIRQQPEVAAATGIIISQYGASITAEKTGLTMKNLDVFAVPPDFDSVFGALPTTSSANKRVADMGENDVILSKSVAQNFNVQVGDTISVQLGSQLYKRTVMAILTTDIEVTAGELVGTGEPGQHAEIFMPLTRFQQIYFDQTRLHFVPNTICLRNKDQAGGSASKSILQFLQRLFGDPPIALQTSEGVSDPTSFNSTLIHPLKPDVAQFLKVAPFISSSDAFRSPAALEFEVLLPFFTTLLVAAGMLLLVLLILLLAAERRAELGISRALGLQKRQLVQIFIFEGCGYAVIAAFLGIVFGLGAVALELKILTLLPSLAPGPGGQPLHSSSHIPLHLAISWPSLLIAWCLSVLTTMIVVWLTALRISRLSIVAAIRDLDERPSNQKSLFSFLRLLWARPLDMLNLPIFETRAGRLERQRGALVGFVLGLFGRGVLFFLIGLGLFWLAQRSSADWMQQIAIVLFIVSIGCLLNWLCYLFRVPQAIARRLGFSLIGLGWLLYGIQEGNIFAQVFLPNSFVSFNLASALAIVLCPLLAISGIIVLIMVNADLLVALLSSVIRRIHKLLPVSRISLVYPLTYRFRTGVTVALLSLIIFLIILLVSNNIGSIQQSQVNITTGNFALLVSLNGPENARLAPVLASSTTLRQDMTAIALMQPLYAPSDEDSPVGKTPEVLLANHSSQKTANQPEVVDDVFLEHTTLSLLARAQGYGSDKQVWDAVRQQAGYAIMREDRTVANLPTTNGFVPFSVQVPDSSDPAATLHSVTVIGLVSDDTYWPAIFLSTRTAATIVKTPFGGINNYYFQPKSDVSAAKAEQDVKVVLNADRGGITVYPLDVADINNFTLLLTYFLSGYLGLGLLFGALSISVIVSRAVVERRQQIGMLRALGFSRALIRNSFLLEASFVITLGLIIGVALASWLALLIARMSYQSFVLPIGPIALILLGCYLIAFIMTVIPARQASHLSPAEALRYE